VATVAAPTYTLAVVAVNPVPDNTIEKFGEELGTHAAWFVSVTVIVATLYQVFATNSGEFEEFIPDPLVVNRI
jgi:hypothetical protein